jgi:hypothetical protein
MCNLNIACVTIVAEDHATRVLLPEGANSDAESRSALSYG